MTNFMTESDDKTRWVLAYVLFGVAEALALVTAWQSQGHNALGVMNWVLPFIAIIPLLSAKSTLSLYKRQNLLQGNEKLGLDISFRLWNMVVFSYVLLVMALAVASRK